MSDRLACIVVGFRTRLEISIPQDVKYVHEMKEQREPHWLIGLHKAIKRILNFLNPANTCRVYIPKSLNSNNLFASRWRISESKSKREVACTHDTLVQETNSLAEAAELSLPVR